MPNNPTQVEPVEGLVARLYRNADEAGECEICPELVRDAAEALSQSSEREAKLVAEIERLWEALEWALKHIGGHCRYDNAQQVVNCLEKAHEALDASRARQPLGGSEEKLK